MGLKRLLIRREQDLWEILEPAEVFYLEARDDDTLVRRRDAGPIHDLRAFGELAALLEPHGFFRIHRSFAVNLDRVRQVRRRDEGRDWEVKMEPPVNRVLPISRGALPGFLAALGAPEPAE